MKDKIIQIISHREVILGLTEYRDVILGLTESGYIYQWILTGDEPRWQWKLVTEGIKEK